MGTAAITTTTRQQRLPRTKKSKQIAVLTKRHSATLKLIELRQIEKVAVNRRLIRLRSAAFCKNIVRKRWMTQTPRGARKRMRVSMRAYLRWKRRSAIS